MSPHPPNAGDEMLGADVLDADGGILGTVARVVSASPDGDALVTIEPGFLGAVPMVALVPLQSFDGSTVRLPFTRTTVETAPAVDLARLDADDEAQLRAHFRWTGGAPTGSSDQDDGVSVIRSEEHLEVSTTVEPSGRARLRKVVVEEEQTVVVRLRRETVVLESIPLDQDQDQDLDTDLGTELDTRLRPDGQVVFETTLHEERAVVTTVVVPVERVTLRVETVLEEETITAPVRSEQVEATETEQH